MNPRSRRPFPILAALFLALVVPAVAPAEPHNREELAAALAHLSAISFSEADAEIHALVTHATLPEVHLLRELLDQSAPVPSLVHLWHGLLERWGELDSAEALAFASARRSGDRPLLQSRAIVGWSKRQPREAWDAILRLSNRGADRRYSLPHVLLTIGESDLPLALELYLDLVPERACLDCHTGNLSLLAFKQGRLDLVFQTLDRMAAGPLRDSLRDSLWDVLGYYLQAEALNDLPRARDAADRDAAEVSLCVGWVGADPAGAFDHVLSLSGSPRFETMLLAVVQEWARGAAPEDVTHLLRRLPADLGERSLLGLAGHLVRINPSATLAWIEGFAASPLRTKSLGDAMDNWTRIDPDAALAHIHETSDRELRSILLWSHLFARTANKTLRPDDLAELDYGFGHAWTFSLLEKLAVRLLDPTVNGAPFFDLAALRTFVGATPNLTESDREKLLATLHPADSD